MSEPPPSYPAPSAYQAGYPPQQGRPRPHGAWFLAPVVLFLAAAAVGVGFAVWAVVGIFQSDASIPADGRPHQVRVSTDGDRMIWTDQSRTTPRCRVVDRASGERLALESPTGHFDRTTGAGEWVGTWQVDPGSGRLQVTCVGPRASSVEIGPAPRIGRIVVGMGIAGALGLAGLVWLIILVVLRSTRRAPAYL